MYSYQHKENTVNIDQLAVKNTNKYIHFDMKILQLYLI